MDTYYLAIVQALNKVKRPGTYATGGKVQLPHPALSVQGIPGKIGLPLCEAQAKAIIEKCSAAPFGRGEDTIVDTTVRRTWQLDPSQFTIGNEEWSIEMKSLCDRVRGYLGCTSKRITCELYKLLLYELGGFFKRHRDTEKAEGMFGTLVIQLISDYSGGELVVYHKNKEEHYQFDGLQGSMAFHYMAFYADCQHEIKPVTEGYRLCLVYNLLYEGSEPCPVPADNQKIVDKVAAAMRKWNAKVSAPDSPPMMAYLFEHQYCTSSFSFDSLKNVDKAVADVMMNVHSQVAFDLYIGMVCVTQMWYGQVYYGDDFHGDDFHGDDHEEDVRIENLVTLNGEKMEIDKLIFDKDCIVPEIDLDDVDFENVSEATGNEGATADKQYKSAALLFWPIGKRAEVGVKELEPSEAEPKKKQQKCGQPSTS